jgi:hypothetical protein
MSKPLLSVLILAGVLAPGTAAFAQCTKDTDCKGDRVCLAGSCAAPTSGAAFGGDSRPFNPRPVRSGWASGAGALGIASGVLVLGLSVGSEFTSSDELVPSLPLGITATVLLGAMGPVVAGGGASARGDGRVEGLLGLRVGGWVAYGLAMANAVALIGLGVADISPPEGQITATGALGMASLVCFSIDAFASGAQARRLALQSTTQAAPAPEVSWGVNVVPLWHEARVDGAALGLGGSF